MGVALVFFPLTTIPMLLYWFWILRIDKSHTGWQKATHRTPCLQHAPKYIISRPRLKNNRYAGLFRADAYPALYPEGTRSLRIS